MTSRIRFKRDIPSGAVGSPAPGPSSASPSSAGGGDRAPSLLLDASRFSHDLLAESPQAPQSTSQLSLRGSSEGSALRGALLPPGGRLPPLESAYESPDHLTSPITKNTRAWKSYQADQELGREVMAGLCQSNTELIDVIEEGDNFGEHSPLDFFVSSIAPHFNPESPAHLRCTRGALPSHNALASSHLSVT
eukprot:RCo042272